MPYFPWRRRLRQSEPKVATREASKIGICDLHSMPLTSRCFQMFLQPRWLEEAILFSGKRNFGRRAGASEGEKASCQSCSAPYTLSP